MEDIMSRMVKPLSDRQCALAKAEGVATKLFDGGGLVLDISPKGLKSWRLIYDQPGNGKRSSITLGHYPAITLSAARDERAAARAKLEAGIDPAAAPVVAVAAPTFESVAREWHGTVYKVNEVGTKTAAQNLRRLELDVFPTLGPMPVDSIAPMAVLAVIRQIEARGATDMSNRVRGLVSKVFDYAVVTGRALSNPAGSLKTVTVAHQGTHMASLRVSELPAFLEALNDYERRPQVRPQTIVLLRTMLWTMGRTAELIETPWSEVDTEAQRWVIPWQRMKMGKRKVAPRKVDHRMFLPPDGWTMLHHLYEASGGVGYVFPSGHSKAGKEHISNNSVLAALDTMGYGGRMTGHGFRSLGKGVLKLLGYDRASVGGLIERALAHKSQEAHGAAYDRELFLRERRDMMLDYAGFLAAVERGEKSYTGALRTVPIGVDPLDDGLDDDDDDL
jgi:integrase